MPEIRNTANPVCAPGLVSDKPFTALMGPVLLMTSVFFFNFLGRLMLAPFLVSIEQELSISHMQAGELFLFTSLGISLALVCSGFLARKVQHRRTILLSSFGVGLFMILISWTSTLAGLKWAMFGLGTAVGLYLPSGISTITSVLPRAHWGKGLALHELAPNLSFIAAPAIAAVTQDIFTWREVFFGLGVAGILMGLVYVRFCQGGRFPGEAPRPAVLKGILQRPQFWILAFLFGLAVGVTFGTYSMLPLYMVEEHGLAKEAANNLLSLSRVPCLAMALGAGWLVDRIGGKRTVLLALGLTGLLTMALGVLHPPALQAGVLVQPLFAVSFFPAAFTLISKVFPSQVRNVAVSFIVPVAVVIGTGLIPTFLGVFGDHGQFDVGFLCLGLLVFFGVHLIHFLDTDLIAQDICLDLPHAESVQEGSHPGL